MVDCVFDLKGSLIGRLTKDKGAKNDTILKDLNIRFKRNNKLVSNHMLANILLVPSVQQDGQNEDHRGSGGRHSIPQEASANGLLPPICCGEQPEELEDTLHQCQ